jgi:hypothetical protein
MTTPQPYPLKEKNAPVKAEIAGEKKNRAFGAAAILFP